MHKEVMGRFFAAFAFVVWAFPAVYAQPPRDTQSSVILVDDFDQPYAANHLGGAYGMVAEGGEAGFDFTQPTIPYLANNSSLKINYKLSRSPGYAFLWMKLGKHDTSHESSDYLDLSKAVFLSFKYRAKNEVNFKIEIHEDRDGDGRFHIERDRVSSVYLDSAKKFPLEGEWIKALLPLKRFSGIKDWSKVLELVFVFEKGQAGEKGQILLDDLIFISRELRKPVDETTPEFIKDLNINLNDQPFQSKAVLKGMNRLRLQYQPGKDFVDMESLALQIQTGTDKWLSVSKVFDPSKNETEITWETNSFNPPHPIQLRFVAYDFFGKMHPIGKTFEELTIQPMTDAQFLDLAAWKAFLYFKDTQHPENGLFYDTTGGGDLSTAVTGFGFSALVIGAEHGWMPRLEAERRIKLGLKTLHDLENHEGFYYHFLDPKTLKRAGTSEISTVDTALLLAGVITAGEYFGGDIKKSAEKLYKKINWKYFLNQNPDEEHFMQFHHGWTPEDGLADNFWDYYTDETLLLDLLAIGAPKNEVPAEVFYKFQRRKGRYKKMPKFIYTWHGSLFSYQYANAWYDFRNIQDQEGVHWFENSKRATLSNRQFVIDHSTEYKTYGPDQWGITSMRVPERYVMHYGPTPNGQNLSEHDGTISPSGPGGSIVFTPYLSLRALKHLYLHYPDLWGIYGFKDSLSLDRYWISPVYYGLGEGILLLSIENFRTGIIWKYFSKNKHVQKGLSKAKFKQIKAKPAASSFNEFKAKLSGLRENEKQRFVTKFLSKKLSYEDLEKIYQEVFNRYGRSDLAAWHLQLASIQSELLKTLQVNDLEAGRRYLEKSEEIERKAQKHLQTALEYPLSEGERLKVYKMQIDLSRQTLSLINLDQARERLAQALQDGVKQRTFNLAWALQYAEQMDEETAIQLRERFFEELPERERRILFESLKRKTNQAFMQGDYRKAAIYSEEQIRFMDKPSHQQVLIGFLDRTAHKFAEVQKYHEAENFYLKILEKYGDAEDKERYRLQLASLLEKKGDKERAIREYEQFIETYPKSPEIPAALTRIANIESSLGNRDKAIDILKMIPSRYAGTVQAQEASYLLGMVYFHAKRYHDAIQAWEGFLSKYPDARQVSVVRDYLERADKLEAKKI